jgi:hypothetical protein
MKTVNQTRWHTLRCLFASAAFSHSRKWRICGYVGFAWILVLGFRPAFGADPGHEQKWQDVRDHQPAGLRLKLALPKDHFFQGRAN